MERGGPVPVRYIDEHLVVVERPSSVPLRNPYPIEDEPLGGLLDTVACVLGEPVFEGVRLGQGASGLVVLGRSQEAARAIKRAAGQGELRWGVLALVEGAGRLGEGMRTVARVGARSLVELAFSQGSLKTVRKALRATGASIVEDHPHGLRLMSVEGRHPVTSQPWSVSCRHDGGARDLLEGRLNTVALVQEAFGRRAACALDGETDCFRVIGEDADGLPGVVVDRFGPVALLHLREGLYQGTRAEAKALAQALVDEVDGVQSVFLRRVAKGGKAEALEETPLAGEPIESDALVVRERGLKYRIELHHGMSPGIFLDQRHNRARVRRMSRGKRVLNTFAHTCGFSVVAGEGGASEVVSVDVLRRYLDWGRDNVALNGLDADKQIFIASDTIDYCRRAARQGRRFDVIILDPPTFGRDKRKRRTFSVVRDLGPLIKASVDILNPGGHLMLCTNHRASSMKDLRGALRAGGRPFEITLEPLLPPDYVGQKGFTKTLWARFE